MESPAKYPLCDPVEIRFPMVSIVAVLMSLPFPEAEGAPMSENPCEPVVPSAKAGERSPAASVRAAAPSRPRRLKIVRKNGDGRMFIFPSRYTVIS